MVTVNGTKTGAARRRVPIEKHLVPLLRLLVKERPTGALVDLPCGSGGADGAAALTRADLKTAGVTRADLTRDNAQEMPFSFHGLRHTAITHWYIAGRDATWLKIVAGHTSSAMTQTYLDAAAMGRKTFGQPHPPLPASVLGGAKIIAIGSARSARNEQRPRFY